MALKAKSAVTQFRVDPDLLRRFQSYCDARQLTVSDAIRRYMLSSVEHWEVKKARDASKSPSETS